MLAPKSKTKEPVPKASDLLSQNKGGSQVGVGSKNYIAENRNRAIHELHPPHLKEVSNAADHHKNFGKIPGYINRYKHDADERMERMRRQDEEAKMPPGTRLMGEEERLETLQEL
jgi:hypothetical protein